MTGAEKKTYKSNLMARVAYLLKGMMKDYKIHEVVHSPGDRFVLLKVIDNEGRLIYFEVNVKETY